MKSYLLDQVQPDISVILPTYNERENIIKLIDGLQEVLQFWYLQIIVVDDNSPDGTSLVVADKINTDDRVVLLTRKDKRGLASALSDGVKLSTGKIVVIMDSDMQMRPDNLPVMIRELGDGYDVVVGSRWMQGGADLRCENDKGASTLSQINRILSRWLSIIAAQAFRVKHTDFTGGLLAMRRDVIVGHVIQGDHGDYLLYLLHFILKNGFKVKEIPYVLVPRTDGESKTTDNYISFFFKGCQYMRAIFYLAVFKRYR